MHESDRDPILDEQIAYYRARATEYDDWWLRRGRYDAGTEFARRWADDIDEARRWLNGRAPLGRVLEIAAGTGNWTVELERLADELVALDSSPEALAICAGKTTRPSTMFVTADVFEWTTQRQFDTIFFSFWLSHVPASAWGVFWRRVGELLNPEGRVLLIDNLDPALAARTAPAELTSMVNRDRIGESDVRTRTTANGQEYRVIKRYWTPATINRDLANVGWRATARQTSFAFLCCEATRDRVLDVHGTAHLSERRR